MPDKTQNLPDRIGVWSRSGPDRIINSENIFDYMNGAGELYLAYRFDHLAVVEYTSEKAEKIVLEIYDMLTSDDAFGLLSLDWGGEPVSLFASQGEDSIALVAPESRALYGAGLLRFSAGNIYARVMAYQESPQSREAVIALGQALVSKKHPPPEPVLLKSLPDRVDSKWRLRSDRIGFFRSHLVLNSLYYLSHQNILNLDPTSEAVTASYEWGSAGKSVKRVQTLVIKYSSTSQAKEGLESFHNGYLNDHAKSYNSKTTRHRDLFKIEDGWVGYQLDNKCLVVIFQCSDQESGNQFLDLISCNRKNKEMGHERK